MTSAERNETLRNGTPSTSFAVPSVNLKKIYRVAERRTSLDFFIISRVIWPNISQPRQAPSETRRSRPPPRRPVSGGQRPLASFDAEFPLVCSDRQVYFLFYLLLLLPQVLCSWLDGVCTLHRRYLRRHFELISFIEATNTVPNKVLVPFRLIFHRTDAGLTRGK